MKKRPRGMLEQAFELIGGLECSCSIDEARQQLLDILGGALKGYGDVKRISATAHRVTNEISDTLRLM